MNKSIFTLMALASMACLSIHASAKDKKSDWVALFDGKSTKGWTPRAKVESFEAKNGELQLFSKVKSRTLRTFRFTVANPDVRNVSRDVMVFLP